MKILMIAPEPYFEPRGTPFSEYFRIRAVCEAGHEVHLVTYPVGEDRLVAGLTIFRCARWFGIRSIKTGPSLKKIVLDLSLFFKVMQRIRREKYDLVHTHEEGNILGVIVNKFKGIPHLYDMHSSLVQQMENFQFSRSRWIKGIFSWIERVSLRNARSVIVICRSLQEYASKIVSPGKLTMIENFMDEEPGQISQKKTGEIRELWGGEGKKLVLYSGTLEAYQGIPILIDAFHKLDDTFRLIIAGGSETQVNHLSLLIDRKGLAERVVLLGQRPAREIPAYLQAADILVSPRNRGTNIPLKIYSYLKSGKPVVATNLYTHTQTLTPEISILTEPEPDAMAEGIRRASGEEGEKVARNAVEFCRKHYSKKRYEDLVAEALALAMKPVL